MADRQYFGTDGIRGEVGTPPITPDFMLKLGWAAGRVFGAEGGGHVLIGKDTRISGYMLESALEAGLSAAGINIRLLGPMPTPAIAYLTQTLHARAGIVISASHNPHWDNGVKFFGAEGRKLPDETESAIEALLDQPMETVPSEALGKADRIGDAAGRYIEFCKSSVPHGFTLRGLKIVLDCANGATYHVAPPVFGELGAEVISIGDQPDGLNINQDCGALYPEALQERVVAEQADVGIALDGDGDRLIMVDDTGALVDGDELLYVIARARRERGGLNGAVVGTVMSNLGLEQALHGLDLKLKRAKVGDRHILEMLAAGGHVLGGETSGHIVCLDKTCTGDGIISALQVLLAMVESGRGLRELKGGMEKLPQVLLNVRMPRRIDPDAESPISRAVDAAEARLNGTGRVLLRPSGTEPVLRIMVEARERALAEQVADELAEAVRTHVGHPA